MIIRESISVNLNLKSVRHFPRVSRNKTRSSLSLKIFLRSFPRDKTCPRANGDVIVSPFKFYTPWSCHGREYNINILLLSSNIITNQGVTSGVCSPISFLSNYLAKRKRL